MASQYRGSDGIEQLAGRAEVVARGELDDGNSAGETRYLVELPHPLRGIEETGHRRADQQGHRRLMAGEPPRTCRRGVPRRENDDRANGNTLAVEGAACIDESLRPGRREQRQRLRRSIECGRGV